MAGSCSNFPILLLYLVLPKLHIAAFLFPEFLAFRVLCRCCQHCAPPSPSARRRGARHRVAVPKLGRGLLDLLVELIAVPQAAGQVLPVLRCWVVVWFDSGGHRRSPSAGDGVCELDEQVFLGKVQNFMAHDGNPMGFCLNWDIFMGLWNTASFERLFYKPALLWNSSSSSFSSAQARLRAGHSDQPGTRSMTD